MSLGAKDTRAPTGNREQGGQTTGRERCIVALLTIKESDENAQGLFLADWSCNHALCTGAAGLRGPEKTGTKCPTDTLERMPAEGLRSGDEVEQERNLELSCWPTDAIDICSWVTANFAKQWKIIRTRVDNC